MDAGDTDDGDKWDAAEDWLSAVDALWESEARPSPAGWIGPGGRRPGWDWVPRDGALARPERMPWWVRLWYGTPFMDRLASEWMWRHGGFDVLPPSVNIPPQPPMPGT